VIIVPVVNAVLNLYYKVDNANLIVVLVFIKIIKNNVKNVILVVNNVLDLLLVVKNVVKNIF